MMVWISYPGGSPNQRVLKELSALMCLSKRDGKFFNHSWLHHSWLKIIPSRLLRHFRATTRVGNPYHHLCYAKNVPYNPAWSRDHPLLKSRTIPGGKRKFPKIFCNFFKINHHHYTVVSLAQIYSDLLAIYFLRKAISIPVAPIVISQTSMRARNPYPHSSCCRKVP